MKLGEIRNTSDLPLEIAQVLAVTSAATENGEA